MNYILCDPHLFHFLFYFYVGHLRPLCYFIREKLTGGNLKLTGGKQSSGSCWLHNYPGWGWETLTIVLQPVEIPQRHYFIPSIKQFILISDDKDVM